MASGRNGRVDGASLGADAPEDANDLRDVALRSAD
jgi:hypothetical protein